MHIYRICLVVLHICSALTYLPHLIIHVDHLPFTYLPVHSQIAFTTYWINYCLLVLAILIWCLFVVCRKGTIWQLIQTSIYLLIIKLIYTLLDVIVRILLHHKPVVIIFDLIHILLSIPTILITYLLVRHVKEKEIFQKNSQTLMNVNHSIS